MRYGNFLSTGSCSIGDQIMREIAQIIKKKRNDADWSFHAHGSESFVCVLKKLSERSITLVKGKDLKI